MAKFNVHLTASIDQVVKVEAEDSDAALDAAYEEMDTGLCVQCSGWGQTWGKDEGDYEAYEVTNEDGETVWEDKTVLG